MAARRSARAPLTRERVLETARDIADLDGIEAVTMRKVAERLGVEAMSLYHHVSNKNAILDGLVELAFAEVEAEIAAPAAASATAPVPTAATWQAVLRARILASRRVLVRHPWVPRLVEGRGTIAPAMIRYVDGVVGTMRAGGLTHDLIHHALHALGSRMYGFTQELGHDDDGGDVDPAVLAGAPHLVAMLADVTHDSEGTLGWCDDNAEFAFALDILLDGIERHRARAADAHD